jgi:spore coat protein CotF
LRVSRVNIIQVLREYFPDLLRTRKSAYKYLIKKGYYNG